MGLLIKDKEFVIPGDVIAEGIDYLPAGGGFREKDKIIAGGIGIVNVDNRLIKIIPLTGAYKPKIGDVVIGQIVNISFNGWSVDIGFSNLAMLSVRDATSEFIERKSDLSRYFDFDEFIVSKISNISKGNLIEYYISETKEKKKLIREKVKLPDEEGEYDIEYYLEHQILPAVENIFQVFGIDINEVINKKNQGKLNKWI